MRSHLPDEVPISTGLHFSHADDRWLVVVKVHADSKSIELGREPLEEFPSELMIAQAMLVV